MAANILQPNINGELSIWANSRGEYLGEKVVAAVNRLIRKRNSEIERIVNESGSQFPRELLPFEDEIHLQRPYIKDFPNTFSAASLEESIRGHDAFLIPNPRLSNIIEPP